MFVVVAASTGRPWTGNRHGANQGWDACPLFCIPPPPNSQYDRSVGSQAQPTKQSAVQTLLMHATRDAAVMPRRDSRSRVSHFRVPQSTIEETPTKFGPGQRTTTTESRKPPASDVYLQPLVASSRQPRARRLSAPDGSCFCRNHGVPDLRS
ncbi:hypothetical protein LZ32DRAFT_301701 [Colletotrichum eremochloae]|nr:hypothetical protein LZ32DRAFT_301701 [Colletotrichum eremochloae]